MTKFLRPVHPGLILMEELAEAGLSNAAFARQIDVPPNRISQIISGKRGITGDTALRFGHWFGVDPRFWIDLQKQYDLARAALQMGEAVRNLPTKASWPDARHQARDQQDF